MLKRISGFVRSTMRSRFAESYLILLATVLVTKYTRFSLDILKLLQSDGSHRCRSQLNCSQTAFSFFMFQINYSKEAGERIFHLFNYVGVDLWYIS